MRGAEWVSELLACFAVLGVAWITGVGWAAYRAVGWVERMRVWAATLRVEASEGECIAGAVLDGRGTE